MQYAGSQGRTSVWVARWVTRPGAAAGSGRMQCPMVCGHRDVAGVTTRE